MNVFERIQRSIDYMETHLAEDIDLSEVARQAFMSLASYYRLFYGFTGYSAKEYIRLRRLSNAALRLTMYDCPTVQIALESGFKSQESFIKAFRATVGITPGQYQRRKHLLRYSFERMNLMNKHFIQTDPRLAAAYPDIRVLKDLPPMRVAGCWIFGDEPERQAHEKLIAWATKEKLLDPKRGYRIFGHDTPAFMGIAHGYEFWLTLPEHYQENPRAAEKDGIVFKDIPSARYIIISTSFKHLFEGKDRGARFIRESPYGFAYSPYLEEHIVSEDEDPEDILMDLYFSINDDPASKEPVEVYLPPMRVASVPVTDGREFEQTYQRWQNLIQSGCDPRACKAYILQNGLDRSFQGPLELWISLPEGVAAPAGTEEKTYSGGHTMQFAVQFTSMDSEIGHCYEILTQRGYKHTNHQLLIQLADFDAPWEESIRTCLYYPVK